MNCRIILLSIAVLMLFGLRAHAQEPTDTTGENMLQDQIENIAENTDAELDYSSLTENLKYFLRHSINLNRTNMDELQQLGLLTDIQIDNLLRHIEKNGALLSLYELQSVEGYDLPTIYSILPYVKIFGDNERKSWDFKDVLKYSKSVLFVRYSSILEEQSGFSPASDSLLEASPNSRYLGSSYKLYTRYRYTYYNLLSVGITAEKDYGEEFFKGSQKAGYDSYSAHFFIKNIGPLKTLSLGDYNLQFGQGLTLWSGLAFGKSSEAIVIKKSGRGIVPYTSVDENLFMRGAAAQIDFKPFSVYGFVSYKKLDANMSSSSDTTNSEEFIISSLQESGLHNTQSTIDDKDLISEFITGGRIEYNGRRFRMGATGYYTKFGQSIAPAAQLYQLYNFTGSENLNAGVDYSLLLKNANIFGELSISENGGKAIINGIMLSPDRLLTISFLHRYLARDYQVFYATAFQESSTVKNEQGFYFGNELKFSRKWTFNSYVDLFSFPWMRYRVDAPSDGIELLCPLTYRPTKKAVFYVRFRQEDKEINSSESHFDVLQPTIKRSFRVNASFPISESVTLKSRAEYLTYKDGLDPLRTGFLIYQDISFRKLGSRFAFSARYAMFDTDSYDERLYAYENDVLYAYSIPAYYYKGSRMYLMIRWSVMHGLDVWARIAQTHYVNQNSTGSGLTEISGPNKTELKLQVRLSF